MNPQKKKKRPKKDAKNSNKDRAKAAAEKADEEQRPVLIRDSFTMPDYDYSKLDQLKERCLMQGVSIKKSELLRAGLRALELLDDDRLRELLDSVERLKTGRPRRR